MHLNQYIKLNDIMKSRLSRHTLTSALIVGSLASTAAHAFVDERTPAPPAAPEIVAPQLVQQPLVVQQPTQAPAVIPGVNTPVAQPLQSGVQGDMSNPAWATTYPGPYGTMPLADALIAQIVPVVGTAIELNGPAELLNRSVMVGSGATRKVTLETLASTYGLTIFLQGNKVNLNSAQTPVPGTSVGQGVATLDQSAAVAEPKRTWTIPKGAMLSTAMLEWADAWGWELIWKADVDYRIAADISLHDTFLGGVGKVLEAYRAGNRPLWGDWNDEQKVLVIREPNNRDN